MFVRYVMLALLALPASADVLGEVTRAQTYEAQRASSSNEDLTRNGDARSIKAGDVLELAALEGPGVVTQFWHTCATKDLLAGRSLVLEVYYDGREAPSVRVPLGDFFVQPHGYVHQDFVSEPIVVSGYGRSRTSYWRMPFHDSIRVLVRNESTVDVDSFYWHLNWQKHESLPDDTVYFHAQYRQGFPPAPGNYTLLETKGHGQYVGTILGVWHTEAGWFGEGDEFFTIDGAELPQLRGTGTEEYFLEAWGMHGHTGPYAGVALYEGVLPGDRVAAYRWHLPDPVPFRESLKFEIEHKGSVFDLNKGIANFEVGGYLDRQDWFSSVAIWYQQPPVEAAALPPVAERMPPVKILTPMEMTYRADPPLVVVPMEGGIGYLPAKPEASIEFDFEVAEAGMYRIDAMILRILMGGVYQPYLDGKEVGPPIDACIKNFTPDFVRLDTHRLTAGTHTFRFERVPGNSPEHRVLAPGNGGFGLARLFLFRLEDMQGFGANTGAAVESSRVID